MNTTHLYNIIFRLVMVVTAVGLPAACSDEIEAPSATCEPGLPAVIRLSVSRSDVKIVSRGELTEGLDRIVNSLYVAVYNSETGRRTGMTVVRDEKNIPAHILEKLTLSALSGPSYIVAVANFDNRPGSTGDDADGTNLEQALLNADTWQKYREISVAYDRQGNINIESPLNPLVMSGFYTESKHSDGSRPAMTPVSISSGTSALPGTVHLRRLTSQVKFNIFHDKNNIGSFSLNSWQVMNLPVNTWLEERDDSDDTRNCPDQRTTAGRRFNNSRAITDIETKGDGLSFDFWMIENRRTGRAPGPEYDDKNAYSWREREYKLSDGTNSGKYMSLVDNADSDDLNNMATYVILDVTMEMKADENGNPIGGTMQRKVDATYVIHLGYCEGNTPLQKAVDFNCRRNTRYSYNVKINNINDLVVEAHSDTGKEDSPGAEGLITDISEDYFQLDAHYSAVNVNFTRENLNDFQYYIVAYDLDGNQVVIDSSHPETIPADGDDRFRYLSWVEFRKTSGENVLAGYKPRSSGDTYLLSEMSSKMSAGWYTMFINEYVYEDGAAADGNESGSVNWHGYVNRPDRRVWLNVDGYVSDDGATIHYQSKYAVSQHSIQTYYDLGATSSGLGVEHENESEGLNLRCNYRYDGSGNANSGRYNLAEYLTSPGSVPSSFSWKDNSVNWSTFIETNSFQQINTVNNQSINRDARTEPLPKIRQNNNGNDRGTTYSLTSYDPDRNRSPRYIEAIRACLNRNRDLDGDGKIDANELRWFVPTTAQYIRIILGRRSLEDPLLYIDGIDRLPTKNGDQNGFNSSMLYYTSDGHMMWSMEGTSSSQWRQWPSSCAAPWNVRCVRNLGGDMTVINDHNVTQPAFTRREGTNIVDLTRYDSKSLRKEPYHSSSLSMPIHHLYDQRYNRCYRAFEFFDSIIYLDDPRLGLNGKRISWSTYLSTTNPCKVLDYTGKTGWRVPNQKELTILGILGVTSLNYNPGNTYSLTNTFGYFDYNGYAPGNNPDDPDGTISCEYRFPMKAVSSTGNMTQSETMNNELINSKKYGIRCVRDVD